MSSWVLHGHNLPALFEVVVKILNGHVVQRSSWTGGTEPFLPWAPMPAVAAQSPSYSPWPLWLPLDAQWPLSQGWEQDSVYHVLYISYHIVLLWVSGLLRNFSAASPRYFFPRHGSHYHVSGLGDACCAACARKSSTAMNLWNATDTNFTQLHHNFVNLMHLQPVCSHCFSTAHLCSGVSLQRSMCWPSTAAPGLTDTLSPSLGMHVSHYGKSMKIRNKRSKCKTHQRYDLSESPIDFEAEQVFVTSARLKK